MQSRLLLTSLLLCIFSVSGYCQTLTGCLPNSVPQGSYPTLSITGSGTSFISATGFVPSHSASIRKTSGGPTYTAYFNPTSATTGTAIFSIPPTAPTGAYSVSAGLVGLTPGLLTVTASASPPMGQVTGKVWSDLDADCIIDASEMGVPSHNVVITPGPYYVSTDSAGNYGAWLPLGSYTIADSPDPSFAVTCPAPTFTYSVNVATAGTTYPNKNFGTNFVPYDNLMISGYHFTAPPGFDCHINYTVRNLSNYFISGATLEVTPDPVLTYLGAVITPSGSSVGSPITPLSIVGGVYTYSLPTIPDGDQVTLRLNFNLPAVTPLGTIMVSTAHIVHADAISSDNDITLTRTVTGSFDPNDKQVFIASGPSAEGIVDPADSVLHYLIRFQNTGTDSARIVRIRDTLDADLDPGTFRFIGASHPCLPSLSGMGNLEFTFNNIMLPDSNVDEPGSHGWVLYRIETDYGVPEGTVINNDASIYFDYNSPVVTNTTNTIICTRVTADYSAVATLPGTTVNFTDASSAATSWLWDFGDGGTSTSPNPSHTYAAPGMYYVCLISSSVCHSDTICDSVAAGCTAPSGGFSHSGGLSHGFTSTGSGATSYAWDFGDGGTSTLPNPTHTYSAGGSYYVCLTVSSFCGSDVFCDTVTISCTLAGSAFTPNNFGSGTFMFDNTTTGALSCFWDFGDGATSTLTDPFHTYSTAGTYTVCLISSDLCSSDTLCQTITICTWPVADFSFVSSGPTAGFTDLSTGGTSWAWTFGDGGTSPLQNPAHTYAAPGTYNVCLSASDTCGIDNICYTVTITCAGPPIADFSWMDAGAGIVNFTDGSSGFTSTYVWDFGDGGSSTAASPSHNYAAPGTYTVCVTVTDTCGSDTYCDDVLVISTDAMAGYGAGAVSLYPNPTTGEFVITGTDALLTGSVTLEIFDITGRMVQQAVTGAVSGTYTFSGNLQTQSAGVYTARITTSRGSAFLRVVKQ